MGMLTYLNWCVCVCVRVCVCVCMLPEKKVLVCYAGAYQLYIQAPEMFFSVQVDSHLAGWRRLTYEIETKR